MRKKTPEMRRTKECWKGMLKRCRTTREPVYSNYTKRGITVCERWLKFKNFLDDMGIKPVGLTLDRTNNNLGYFPGNCRWVTKAEQNMNRRNSIFIEVDGVKKTLTQLAIETGIRRGRIYDRLRDGVTSVERLLQKDRFPRPLGISTRSRK